MADGVPYRFQQPRAGPYFYPQQHQQNHHQRHIARNGSPVNNGRSVAYNNDTPSPSRSPVSSAASHNPYGMYNHNHQQAHQMMMNGAGQQGYMQMNMGHKYQHQNHQQHHGQQNQHHQQNQIGGPGGGMGHQHTFSSGTMSNATPNFSAAGLHNGSTTSQSAMGESVPEHWAHQLQLAAEARQNQGPHHHAKKEGVVSMVRNSQQSAEEGYTEGGEDRNRAMTNGTSSVQHWESLDLSGQGLQAIAQTLFENYSFLTHLFLDNNNLIHISSAIGRLRSLTTLDLSYNKIIAIPPEIGMLSDLKDFRLFGNQVRELPTEIGLLYRLEVLGIEGNAQLDEGQRTMMIEQGTKALVTHLRENSQAGPPPDPRQWITFDDRPAAEIFSVLSYNILCEKYATSVTYGYTPSQALDWNYRCKLLLEEIKSFDADFVCLQEVDQESFSEVFRSEFAYHDYKGYFAPKTRAKTMSEKEARGVDGCATFWKGSKYICLGKEVIEFGHLAINRPDMKGEHDVFNRVMTKDNIAVINFFENRQTGSRFIVANAHITWDPSFADVKLVQVAILMEQVNMLAEKWSKHPPCKDKIPFRPSEMETEFKNTSPERAATPAPSAEYSSPQQIPLLICGDFNIGADSGVYEFITQGRVAPDHCDLGNRKYGNFTRDGITHPFRMKSAYNETHELSFTNYTPGFSGVLDYIWYSTNALQMRGLLGNVDQEYIRRAPGFPNHHFPSDHLPIKAEFSVQPRK